MYSLEHDRPSQKDLNVYVVPYVTLKWKALGEVLLDDDILAKNPLEIINTDNPQNVQECCKQMFIKWLATDNDASWKKLIEALQCPSVELIFFANQIKGILKKGKTILAIWLDDYNR